MGRVLGIAGTAKNTGKTTTLQAVVRFLRERGAGVFLTSIGYDGEDIDTVTGLPKPKVIVEEGDMVATALPLLEVSPVRFSSVTPTGVDCALGPIYTGIAASPGKVVLAGPVSTKDVTAVCEIAPPGRTVLLDGAFSRLAPMVLADNLILATGAARSTDPRRIAAEMEVLATVFGLPEYGGGRLLSDADLLFPAGLYVEGQDERAAARIAAALGMEGYPAPVEAPAESAAECMPKSPTEPLMGPSSEPSAESLGSHCRFGRLPAIVIDGVVNPTVFSSMVSKVRTALEPLDSGSPSSGVKAQFVLAHPIFMLLSGDMAEWMKALGKAHDMGFHVSVSRKPNLLGFTVNPFRPEFDPIRNAYTALYVDAAAYLSEIRSLTAARCADIVYEGTAELESWLSGIL